MSEDWKETIDRVLAEAESIRDRCRNRNDPAFDQWHEFARHVVIEYLPIKLLAFDEIRFASDYFLSKSGEEQQTINDRIALVCDMDLVIKLFREMAGHLEDQRRFLPETVKPVTPDPVLGQKAGKGAVTPALSTPDSLESARKNLEAYPFNARDKAELMREIDLLEAELKKNPPDWDFIKRSLKFILDFDRNLAIEWVPLILSQVPRKSA